MRKSSKVDKNFKDTLRLVPVVHGKCNYSKPYLRVRNNKLEFVKGSLKCRLKT